MCANYGQSKKRNFEGPRFFLRALDRGAGKTLVEHQAVIKIFLVFLDEMHG